MKIILLILIFVSLLFMTNMTTQEQKASVPKDPIILKYERQIDSLTIVKHQTKDKSNYIRLNDEINKKKFELKVYQIKKKPYSKLTENEKLILELDNVEQKIQNK